MTGSDDDPLREESGQSTTEYAIVFMVFLAMVVGLGLFWRVAHEGTFVDEAEGTMARRPVIGLPGLAEPIQDLFMF